MENRLIYIASAYTHPSEVERHKRFLEVLAFTAEGFKLGYDVFSPIVQCHEMALRHKMPHDIDFWWRHNEAWLKKAAGFIVFGEVSALDASRGVEKETIWALDNQLPLIQCRFHVHPTQEHNTLFWKEAVPEITRQTGFPKPLGAL